MAYKQFFYKSDSFKSVDLFIYLYIHYNTITNYIVFIYIFYLYNFDHVLGVVSQTRVTDGNRIFDS